MLHSDFIGNENPYTVVHFDTDQIRQLLADIGELTPRISAGIDDVNQYADDAGLPRVHWQAPYR